MMPEPHTDLTLAAQLPALEAWCLDARLWEEWLNLYTHDAVFWVPTWRDEDTLTEDPDRELSFIYLTDRALLAERVKRLQSGHSPSALPLPRTTHVLGPTQIRSVPDSSDCLALTAWQTTVYFQKDGQSRQYSGRYEHLLRRADDGWMIARKKVILINDYLISQLDFFYV